MLMKCELFTTRSIFLRVTQFKDCWYVEADRFGNGGVSQTWNARSVQVIDGVKYRGVTAQDMMVVSEYGKTMSFPFTCLCVRVPFPLRL